jgi:hypothetical protein
VPTGEVQGAAHVTVNVAGRIVAGAIDSVNTATIDALIGAFGVGPGDVVAGAVNVTRGRIVSGEAPAVMKLHVYGAAIATPVATLFAPVIVPVYRVSGARLVVGVNV